MIISLSILNDSIRKYKKKPIETYHEESFPSGMVTGFALLYVILALIFFILEIIVLIKAIEIALKQDKDTCIVHIVLSIAFTYPYMLIYLYSKGFK